ncbi:MAG: 1-acyl-sn-glycerol-3-phosphate acyltransferase [Bacteroidales bacterium]|jgi:1-acyl-sn-glycerol-3-phosphate acyltransferase|nr:1-acyl-sn-glycerol-3-phosphate acyltransferase [Bacteroidales bacterium]
MYHRLASYYLVILFVTTSSIYVVVAALLRAVTGGFDRKLKILHLFSCFWASCYTWLNPLWSVVITGREHIDGRKACVMVSNHQSVVDILVIYRLFRHFKWVAKSSLFSIPFIGWNMRLNRYVRIERSSLKSQRKMIRQCEEHIRTGSSVMIFPEGTRSSDGQLRPFKEGAFHIALQQKADIVPMVIDGSAKALPQKGLLPFNRQTVYLHVLPPVSCEKYGQMTAAELTGEIRRMMEEELTRMRNIL